MKIERSLNNVTGDLTITESILVGPTSCQSEISSPAGTPIFESPSGDFCFCGNLCAANMGGGGIGTIEQVLICGNNANGQSIAGVCTVTTNILAGVTNLNAAAGSNLVITPGTNKWVQSLECGFCGSKSVAGTTCTTTLYTTSISKGAAGALAINPGTGSWVNPTQCGICASKGHFTSICTQNEICSASCVHTINAICSGGCVIAQNLICTPGRVVSNCIAADSGPLCLYPGGSTDWVIATDACGFCADKVCATTSLISSTIQVASGPTTITQVCGGANQQCMVLGHGTSGYAYANRIKGATDIRTPLVCTSCVKACSPLNINAGASPVVIQGSNVNLCCSQLIGLGELRANCAGECCELRLTSCNCITLSLQCATTWANVDGGKGLCAACLEATNRVLAPAYSVAGNAGVDGAKCGITFCQGIAVAIA
jgi:hypothetical protein